MLQLYMRNLSLGRRHLVNAYEVEAGIGVIAGNTVWSMPECLEREALQKARYINTLTFTFIFSLIISYHGRPARWIIPFWQPAYPLHLYTHVYFSHGK